MLNAESVKRIKFVTKSDIQEYINKDQLWEHMGGTVSLITDVYMVINSYKNTYIAWL